MAVVHAHSVGKMSDECAKLVTQWDFPNQNSAEDLATPDGPF
jgi:hypothetical protein